MTEEITNETLAKTIEILAAYIGELQVKNEMQQNRIEALEKKMEILERADYHCAPEEHYHDEYASVDHVERSEHSFNSQLDNIKNDISNLEYRVNDAVRKAERAQSAADDAKRSARGGW